LRAIAAELAKRGHTTATGKPFAAARLACAEKRPARCVGCSLRNREKKRRLLNFVLSNCTWEDGDVVATFREPFDLLAQTATNSAQLGTGEESKSAKNEIWLPFLDTYRTMCRTPEPNFRQILEDVRALRFA
jgi:hypothetical protein